jgi:CRISPR system Cascade subunit CasA
VSDRPSFDLLERPWIVATRQGETVHLGLRALLMDAHELQDLAVPLPPAAAMLWRVLYALAARVTGLAEPDVSADAWHARRGQVLVEGRFDRERVGAYLDRVADRFDLFHAERPWMQDPRLLTESPKSAGVDKLVLGRPADNNQVWFDHHHDGNRRPLPAAEACWHLLAQLGFGPSGTGAVRTISGAAPSKTLRAGPLRGALSFHPLGANLFESLVADCLSLSRYGRTPPQLRTCAHGRSMRSPTRSNRRWPRPGPARCSPAGVGMRSCSPRPLTASRSSTPGLPGRPSVTPHQPRTPT